MSAVDAEFSPRDPWRSHCARSDFFCFTWPSVAERDSEVSYGRYCCHCSDSATCLMMALRSVRRLRM
jgi:hypothetical protein